MNPIPVAIIAFGFGVGALCGAPVLGAVVALGFIIPLQLPVRLAASVIRIHTLYSLYEVDEENRQIRRVSGLNAPTPRFGVYGEWRPYHELVGIEVDAHPPTVRWPDGGFTVLSKVIAVQTSMFNEEGVAQHSGPTPVEVLDQTEEALS